MPRSSDGVKVKVAKQHAFFLAQSGVCVSINIAISFSTLALDRVGGQRHAPAPLAFGKDSSHPLYTTLGGSQFRTRRVRIILHATGSNSEACSR